MGKSEGVPGIRLGSSPYSCGVCPSRGLEDSGDAQTGKQRLGKLGGMPRRVPGKGPRGRQKAEQGRQWKGADK